MRQTFMKLGDIFDRRMKLSVVTAIAASTLLALLDMVAISLILPLVDLLSGAESSEIIERVSRFLGNPDQQDLISILAITVVGLFIAKDVGAIFYAWWLSGFKSIERVKLQARLLKHFLDSPYTEISRRSSSDMLRTLTSAVTQVFGTAVFGLMNVVTNVISITAIVAALLIAAPLPTLAVILYFGLAASVYFLAIKPIATRAGIASARASKDGYSTALAALGGIKELNLRDTQAHFVERYREASLRGAYAGRTAEFLGGLPKYVLEILFIIAVGVFFVFGADSRNAGSTVGLLSLFVAGGFRVLPAITGLLGNLTQFRYGQSFLDIVHDEVLSSQEIAQRAEEPGPPIEFRDLIELEDISFRYPSGDRDVLSNVSLTIPSRSTFAFVGASGAGKTTLADVLLGLHEPSSGRIRVDGIDIADKKRRWQRNVGYVAQEIFLLDATLAENIAFDQDSADIDRDRLQQAISQAQLEELVAEFPEGVDTELGERGMRLSGGQKQRVGIARALYRLPRMLVLDEATAALDNETEHRITRTVTALHDKMTVVIIAHRLSTIRHCDQVAFLKSGRVEAVGTFDELVQENADFAELVRLASLTRTDDSPAAVTE